jgi:hypothetical protein
MTIVNNVAMIQTLYDLDPRINRIVDVDAAEHLRILRVRESKLTLLLRVLSGDADNPFRYMALTIIEAVQNEKAELKENSSPRELGL